MPSALFRHSNVHYRRPQQTVSKFSLGRVCRASPVLTIPYELLTGLDILIISRQLSPQSCVCQVLRIGRSILGFLPLPIRQVKRLRAAAKRAGIQGKVSPHWLRHCHASHALDRGALIHPDIKEKSRKQIEKALGVPVKKGTIASLKTVGMAAVVTNKGCLCHPKITEEEKQHLEDLFEVNVMIGTVNHGYPMIGSGLVANTKGAIIGNRTTGIEMGRIEEALGFLD